MCITFLLEVIQNADIIVYYTLSVIAIIFKVGFQDMLSSSLRETLHIQDLLAIVKRSLQNR